MMGVVAWPEPESDAADVIAMPPRGGTRSDRFRFCHAGAAWPGVAVGSVFNPASLFLELRGGGDINGPVRFYETAGRMNLHLLLSAPLLYSLDLFFPFSRLYRFFLHLYTHRSNYSGN